MGAAACESYDHGIGARPSGNRLRHRLGQRPRRLITALLQRVCFNYFFIPPIHTLPSPSHRNWIAFVVFVATASRGRTAFFAGAHRAEEAEARRIEIERLYRH